MRSDGRAEDRRRGGANVLPAPATLRVQQEAHTSVRQGTSKRCPHDPKGLRDELRVEKPFVGALPEEERRRREEERERRTPQASAFARRRLSESRCQPFSCIKIEPITEAPCMI